MDVKVIGLDVMEDASGAPAIVEVGPYRYACDTLGHKTAVNCISSTGTRSAAMKARHAYNSAVLFATTAAWRERNVAMYAEPLHPSVVDVSTISEYGLTQKLSNAVRCF